MSMNAFDILLVTVCAYLLVGILDRASPGSWVLLGLFAGIGLQNKLTMLVFGFAAFVSLVLARPRALASRWPWLGGALAIFLPHLIWQAVNDWPTLVEQAPLLALDPRSCNLGAMGHLAYKTEASLMRLASAVV